MRYLWTKPRQAFVMLVIISFKHSRKWIIPVPIWVVEETIQALHDAARVLERILQASRKNREKQGENRWTEYIAGMPVSSTLKVGSNIIRDLRKQGRFRLVEVEDSNIQLYVDLF